MLELIGYDRQYDASRPICSGDVLVVETCDARSSCGAQSPHRQDSSRCDGEVIDPRRRGHRRRRATRRRRGVLESEARDPRAGARSSPSSRRRTRTRAGAPRLARKLRSPSVRRALEALRTDAHAREIACVSAREGPRRALAERERASAAAQLGTSQRASCRLAAERERGAGRARRARRAQHATAAQAEARGASCAAQVAALRRAGRRAGRRADDAEGRGGAGRASAGERAHAVERLQRDRARGDARGAPRSDDRATTRRAGELRGDAAAARRGGAVGRRRPRRGRAHGERQGASRSGRRALAEPRPSCERRAAEVSALASDAVAAWS